MNVVEAARSGRADLIGTVSNLCGGVRIDEQIESEKVMMMKSHNNVENVKDLCDARVVPSVVECVFKRGTFLLHNMKGEK